MKSMLPEDAAGVPYTTSSPAATLFFAVTDENVVVPEFDKVNNFASTVVPFHMALLLERSEGWHRWKMPKEFGT
jgi:hypothetical protein